MIKCLHCDKDIKDNQLFCSRKCEQAMGIMQEPHNDRLLLIIRVARFKADKFREYLLDKVVC